MESLNGTLKQSGNLTGEEIPVIIKEKTVVEKDYENLDNKPSINGTVLDGNKTPEELGLTKASDFELYKQSVDHSFRGVSERIRSVKTKSKTYTDNAIEAAKAYSDGKNSDLETAINETINNKNNATRAYASHLVTEEIDARETADEETLIASKSYTDEKIAEASDGDVTAKGNPVQLDGLQGGVPFSEITVSGKNLLPAMSNSLTRNGITYTVNADGTITLNGTAEKTDGVDVAFKNPLKAGVYTLSGCPKGGSATSFGLRAGLGTANTLYGRDYGNGLKITTETDTVITVTIQNAEIGRVFDNLVFRPQLELGSTPTAYEPPITGRELTVNVNGTDYIITPDSNPYTVPNDIRQLDGLNTISVSAGTLSVTGVRRNAALKRVWKEMNDFNVKIGNINTILESVTGGAE